MGFSEILSFILDVRVVYFAGIVFCFDMSELSVVINLSTLILFYSLLCFLSKMEAFGSDKAPICDGSELAETRLCCTHITLEKAVTIS